MARTYWRATHHPVAIVFSKGQFSLIVLGRDLAFVGGLAVAHAAEAMMTGSTDLAGFRMLEQALALQANQVQAQ